MFGKKKEKKNRKQEQHLSCGSIRLLDVDCVFQLHWHLFSDRRWTTNIVHCVFPQIILIKQINKNLSGLSSWNRFIFFLRFSLIFFFLLISSRFLYSIYTHSFNKEREKRDTFGWRCWMDKRQTTKQMETSDKRKE